MTAAEQVEIPVLEGQITIDEVLPPKRIQRRRVKGWRMPPNTVYVGRGSRWGNPNKIGDPSPIDGLPMEDYEAVSEYWANLMYGRDDMPMPSEEEIRAELAGKNLACWCPADQPCHADVLLELANDGVVS